jgi:hypothetical protein
MAKYKVGDTVRIRSKAWIDAQEKDAYGYILAPKGCSMDMLTEQQTHAGEAAEIRSVDADGTYQISTDNEYLWWAGWMFEDSAEPDMLSPEEAARALLNKEILVCNNGFEYRWWFDRFVFYKPPLQSSADMRNASVLPNLRRRSAKRKRPMNRWEALSWANSEASRGWVVASQDYAMVWTSPQCFHYDGDLSDYKRARLLPDLSGVDESTIQGFEVEDELLR